MAAPESRNRYLSSLLDIENVEKATLSLFPLDMENDTPITTGKPLIRADLIHVQNVQIQQEERCQTIMSSADDGKMVFFGRTTRVYGVSGYLVDSQLSLYQGSRADDRLYAGHSMNRWDAIYDRYFRVSKCVMNNWIVQFKFRKSVWYGYLLSNIKALESTAPSICLVNFTFLTLSETENLDIPRTGDERTEFPGTICAESFKALVGRPPKDFKDPTEARYTAVGLFMQERDKVPPVVMVYEDYRPSRA